MLYEGYELESEFVYFVYGSSPDSFFLYLKVLKKIILVYLYYDARLDIRDKNNWFFKH